MAGRTNAARARLRLLAALLLLLLLPLGAAAAGAPEAVVELREDRACYQAASHRFCYTNTRAPQWHDIWTRVQIRVNSSQGIRVTQVDSEEELRELEEFRVWNFLFSFLKEKLNNTSIDVDLYGKKTCLKVEVPEAGTTYCVMLSRRFDPKLFLVFFLGLLLFFCGDVLSRSQLFYYSAGISIGLLASVLIVFYVMSKVMPKKSPVYLLLVGGWSFSLYLLQLIFKNLREICKSYWQYLLSYMLLVGLVSFGVCYRYGPLENERSINLLSWTLQLLGLLLMYSGIQIRPVALALVLVAICAKHLDHPVQWAYAAYRARWRHARPSRSFEAIAEARISLPGPQCPASSLPRGLLTSWAAPLTSPPERFLSMSRSMAWVAAYLRSSSLRRRRKMTPLTQTTGVAPCPTTAWMLIEVSCPGPWKARGRTAGVTLLP
ncbi:nuclear envelope integral membrane protein 1 isoform X4 [Cygnus atratus]|uniref:nuclear envelope integral membrane protein 1 isoform X4 n=1 Tax=Cygnus atratus TaxID=8868 RepID=UPI0015D622B4|nr:nuclear envelope integral membrane protein 1 isoform X4 [Cygnus atratus]